MMKSVKRVILVWVDIHLREMIYTKKTNALITAIALGKSSGVGYIRRKEDI